MKFITYQEGVEKGYWKDSITQFPSIIYIDGLKYSLVDARGNQAQYEPLLRAWVITLKTALKEILAEIPKEQSLPLVKTIQAIAQQALDETSEGKAE